METHTDKTTQHGRLGSTKSRTIAQWHGRAILASKPRTTTYDGLGEHAAAGLHEFAFSLFRKYVAQRSRVLDLGSGEGAWAKRLFDAQYRVTACDVAPPSTACDLPFTYQSVDLNANFGDDFSGQAYDAVSFVEVIEHLENPRHCFRQIAGLLRDGGIVLLSTPNASGLYSRLRFFFTGQMAMFTDAPFFPPISLGDVAKVIAWVAVRPFMFGTVGGQSIIYVLRKGI